MSILIRIIQDLNNKIRSHLPAADFYYSSAAGFTGLSFCDKLVLSRGIPESLAFSAFVVFEKLVFLPPISLP